MTNKGTENKLAAAQQNYTGSDKRKIEKNSYYVSYKSFTKH